MKPFRSLRREPLRGGACPDPDNAGRAVPITLTVSYDDPRGHDELPPLSRRLRIFRPDELRAGLEEVSSRQA
jgi:hypothetical protein